ncbi:MAG: hypothetical protein U9Q78_01450 [Chloroflexota bacterium]|nr:hypothetical protein [Chloroflexota bacterium]
MATHAYADSGAFYSVFLPFVAHHPGIEMTRGERKQITVGNGGIITVYLHHVGFRLGDEHFTATIGFSSELGIGFNLLGRFSIFDRLMFCFNDHEDILYVSCIGGTGDG